MKPGGVRVRPGGVRVRRGTVRVSCSETAKTANACWGLPMKLPYPDEGRSDVRPGGREVPGAGRGHRVQAVTAGAGPRSGARGWSCSPAAPGADASRRPTQESWAAPQLSQSAAACG